MAKLIDYFTTLTDPRIDRTKEHLLEDIIFIAIASVICGAETWNDMESYGRNKLPWLEGILSLPNGIPSHDTFNRVFSALDPVELESCFMAWVKSVARLTEGEVVSIDGKTLRGSRGKTGKSFVHMVSAWSDANHMVLGQLKVDDKSNEITAIPQLLDALLLEGCIVTIDAMGCQVDIAQKIIERQADYILAVKDNQPTLKEAVLDTVRFYAPTDSHEQVDMGHGRVETRKCFLYHRIDHLETPSKWCGLHAFVRIEAERYHKASGKTERETRFYITSHTGSAEQIGKAVRTHWGIENSLHWLLDVAFGEDASQKKEGNSAQNFSIINRVALNLLKNDQSKNRSVKGKRKDAGWNDQYLLDILNN